MVDLDLDVVRRFDGSAEILDEDEFAEHQVRYGYPPEGSRGTTEPNRTRHDEPSGAGHQDAKNWTMLHQYSRISGSGGFLPRFLPKSAA